MWFLLYVFVYLMNFFFLHTNPQQCARYHGDKHLNKMQTEYAQILCFVWHILVFEKEGVLDEHMSRLKEQMYKKNKSHLKHPVVLWASQSQAHYNAILDLGLALGDEKIRRIDNMKHLDAKQRPKKAWKREHKSQEMLRLLRDNVPALHLFPNGNQWSDPPKCMPEYLHNNTDNGEPFSVIDSYRLFYTGNKITITGLKWEPFVEEPDFVAIWKAYINEHQTLKQNIDTDLKKEMDKKEKKKRKREGHV
jgi:hypothetical protein